MRAAQLPTRSAWRIPCTHTRLRTDHKPFAAPSLDATTQPRSPVRIRGLADNLVLWMVTLRFGSQPVDVPLREAVHVRHNPCRPRVPADHQPTL